MVRRRQRPRLRRRLPGWVGVAALIASLGLHAGLLVGLARLGAGSPDAGPPVPIAALAPLTAADWDANRSIQGEARAPMVRPPAPPPPAPPEPEVRGPVVEVPTTPDDPSRRKVHPDGEQVFLADRDSFAEKNTVARDTNSRNQNNLSRTQSGIVKPEARAVPGDGGIASRTTPGRPGESGAPGTGASRLELPNQSPRDRVALAPGGGDGEVAARHGVERLDGWSDRLAVPGTSGSDGGRAMGSLDPRLRPSQEALERIAAGGPMFSIGGVEEGDEMLLNTREFKYAGFFNRSKRAIVQEWSADRAYMLRDPDFSIYPVKDRTTVVAIKLNADGSLKDVRVVRRSGLDFLDEEAVRAVRAATPFPNPPSALVKDGEIDYGLFGFKVTFGTSLHAGWQRSSAAN
jgi:TonB family protein